MLPPCIALSLRPKVGRFLHMRICTDTLALDDLSISQYQRFKERLAGAGATRSGKCNLATSTWLR